MTVTVESIQPGDIYYNERDRSLRVVTRDEKSGRLYFVYLSSNGMRTTIQQTLREYEQQYHIGQKSPRWMGKLLYVGTIYNLEELVIKEYNLDG